MPENRAELCRREDELERRLLIKEAKEEMWRKWRQTKGRRGGAVRYKNDLERLEIELEKAEKELKRYQEEKKEQAEREEQREKRKARKREKERHWDMLRWILRYIE